MSAKVGKINPVSRFMVNTYLMRFKEKAFLKRKVREILFEGYKVDMIDEVQKITGMKILPNSTFGLYYGVSVA